MDTEGESQVSAFLEKQKVLDFLRETADNEPDPRAQDALRWAYVTICAGYYDWAGESE